MKTKLEAIRGRVAGTAACYTGTQEEKDRAFLLRLVDAYQQAYDAGWESDRKKVSSMLEQPDA